MLRNTVRNFLFITLCLASFSACLFINLDSKSIPDQISSVKATISQENKVVLPDVEAFMYFTKKAREVISSLPTK